MLADEATVIMGLSGAMVPAGMRNLIAYLIGHRFIDCLVSTGANLFHDCHETLGRAHYKGDPHFDDVTLFEHGIDKIYDTFASEGEFRETDLFIADFARGLNSNVSYTTREFLHRLGGRLAEEGINDGILTAATRAQVPVYCPAIGDSSIGIALTTLTSSQGRRFQFDVIGDVEELTTIVADSRKTGVIYIGGGTPKNFIQQTEVTASILGREVTGHDYAIQIIVDAPYWGGLSGCTFEEAQSWGKISKSAKKVTVYCDATIALPLVVTALAEEEKELQRGVTVTFRLDRILEMTVS
jgi:deoxyhypusine synthase